jgi:hypothetical protein
VTQPAKKRTCARCGHHGYPAASFPEGYLCHRCLTAALAVAGTCPGCGAGGRVLPGLRDGVRICRDCAGITRDFSCLRCGTEAGMAPATRRSLRRLCDPCAVTWTAARLLDDGSGASHQREGVRAFLVWAAGHGHIPGHLDSPRQQPYTGQVITQQRRLDLLRRFATDEAIPIRTRAAACLMLLYAQPLSRILRLSAADLSRDDDGQTWLRLGDPPSPVPAPFGALLHQLAATRHDHVPANHGSDWLFPGRHAGQPAAYRPMAAQLREHGLPLRTARISALRQLVLQVPAPVIAGALGFHHTTTTRQHVKAAGPWSQYAGGDREPHHTGCRALPAGLWPGQDSIPYRAAPQSAAACPRHRDEVVGMRGGLGVTLHAQLPGLPVLSRPRAQPAGHPAVHEQPGPRAGIGRVSPGRQLYLRDDVSGRLVIAHVNHADQGPIRRPRKGHRPELAEEPVQLAPGTRQLKIPRHLPHHPQRIVSSTSAQTAG